MSVVFKYFISLLFVHVHTVSGFIDKNSIFFHGLRIQYDHFTTSVNEDKLEYSSIFTSHNADNSSINHDQYISKFKYDVEFHDNHNMVNLDSLKIVPSISCSNSLDTTILCLSSLDDFNAIYDTQFVISSNNKTNWNDKCHQLYPVSILLYLSNCQKQNQATLDNNNKICMKCDSTKAKYHHLFKNADIKLETYHIPLINQSQQMSNNTMKTAEVAVIQSTQRRRTLSMDKLYKKLTKHWSPSDMIQMLQSGDYPPNYSGSEVNGDGSVTYKKPLITFADKNWNLSLTGDNCKFSSGGQYQIDISLIVSIKVKNYQLSEYFVGAGPCLTVSNSWFDIQCDKTWTHEKSITKLTKVFGLHLFFIKFGISFTLDFVAGYEITLSGNIRCNFDINHWGAWGIRYYDFDSNGNPQNHGIHHWHNKRHTFKCNDVSASLTLQFYLAPQLIVAIELVLAHIEAFRLGLKPYFEGIATFNYDNQCELELNTNFGLQISMSVKLLDKTWNLLSTKWPLWNGCLIKSSGSYNTPSPVYTSITASPTSTSYTTTAASSDAICTENAYWSILNGRYEYSADYDLYYQSLNDLVLAGFNDTDAYYYRILDNSNYTLAYCSISYSAGSLDINDCSYWSYYDEQTAQYSIDYNMIVDHCGHARRLISQPYHFSQNLTSSTFANQLGQNTKINRTSGLSGMNALGNQGTTWHSRFWIQPNCDTEYDYNFDILTSYLSYQLINDSTLMSSLPIKMSQLNATCSLIFNVDISYDNTLYKYDTSYNTVPFYQSCTANNDDTTYWIGFISQFLDGNVFGPTVYTWYFKTFDAFLFYTECVTQLLKLESFLNTDLSVHPLKSGQTWTGEYQSVSNTSGLLKLVMSTDTTGTLYDLTNAIQYQIYTEQRDHNTTSLFDSNSMRMEGSWCYSKHEDVYFFGYKLYGLGYVDSGFILKLQNGEMPNIDLYGDYPKYNDTIKNTTIAIGPSFTPTLNPTITKTVNPTITKTINPTITKTVNPTITKTEHPTIAKTVNPTIVQTINPTTVMTTVETTTATISALTSSQPSTTTLETTSSSYTQKSTDMEAITTNIGTETSETNPQILDSTTSFLDSSGENDQSINRDSNKPRWWIYIVVGVIFLAVVVCGLYLRFKRKSDVEANGDFSYSLLDETDNKQMFDL